MSLDHITLARAAAPARSAAARPGGRRGVRPSRPAQVQLPTTKRQAAQSKLALWLAANELDDVESILEEHGIQLLADLRTLSRGDFEALGLGCSQVDRLWRALHAQAPPAAPPAGAAAEQPADTAAQDKQGRSRGLRDRLPFKRGHRKPLRTSETAPAPAPAPASRFRTKQPQEARLVAHAAVPQQPSTPQQAATPTSICSSVGTPVATYDRDRCPDTGKLRILCHCGKCKNPEASSVLEQQDSAWAEKKRAERLAEIEALGLSPRPAKPLVQRLAVPASMPPRDGCGGGGGGGGGGAVAAVATPRATTAGALPTAAPPAAAPTGTAWQEVRAADGRIYFWNRDTNATTWGRPAELPVGGHDGARRRVRRSAPAGATDGAPAAESSRLGGAAEPDGGRRRRRRPAGEAAAPTPAAAAAASGATGRRRRTRAGEAAPTAPETRAPVAPAPAPTLVAAPAQRRRKRREPVDRV